MKVKIRLDAPNKCFCLCLKRLYLAPCYGLDFLHVVSFRRFRVFLVKGFRQIFFCPHWYAANKAIFMDLADDVPYIISSTACLCLFVLISRKRWLENKSLRPSDGNTLSWSICSRCKCLLL